MMVVRRGSEMILRQIASSCFNMSPLVPRRRLQQKHAQTLAPEDTCHKSTGCTWTHVCGCAVCLLSGDNLRSPSHMLLIALRHARHARRLAPERIGAPGRIARPLFKFSAAASALGAAFAFSFTYREYRESWENMVQRI